MAALDGLRAFHIDNSGAANLIVNQIANAVTLAVHPSQEFLYAILASAANIPGLVTTYGIDADTGAIARSPIQADTEFLPRSIRFHPNGRLAYVSNYVSGTISIFDVAPDTGVLSSPRTQQVGGNPYGIAMDPSGAFLFFLKQEGTVQSYSVNATSGALTFRNSVNVGDDPNRIAVTPTGSFVYVSFRGAVSRYAVNPTTGVLSDATTVEGGTGNAVLSVALDPAGRFAYVANVPDRTITAYRVDPNTGLLSSPVITPMIGEPRFHTVDPTGQILLATDRTEEKVAMFAISQVTGALHSFGTPFTAGTQPGAMSIVSFPD